MIEFLSYGFVQRGLLSGSLIAVVCALLGVFLVLKRLSLIGDGLSHVCLTGVALALLTGGSPVYVSIPVVWISSLGIMKLIEKVRVYGDAAIGIVSAFGIASGLLITSLAGGFNTDLLGYLFGSILTVGETEVVLCAVIFIILLSFLIICYRDLMTASFDEAFAVTRGINVKRLNFILISITSVAIVLAFKVVGIFLISALIIIPPVAALLIAKSFKQILWLASLFSLFSVWTGVHISFVFDIPSGAAIILMNLGILTACFISSKLAEIGEK